MPPRRQQLSAADLLGAAVVSILSLVFLLLWWRDYVAVTNDAWHAFGGWRIVNGEVPYRDYYLFIPPFHQIKLAFLTAVFGPKLIYFQLWGILERLALGVVLYFWLRRVFAPGPSAAGVAFGLYLYYLAQSETLSSMVHEAAFWPALAGASAACALGRENGRKWWLIAGVLSGITFWTKQTTGVGIGVALGIFLLAMVWRRGRGSLWDLAAHALGWALPALAIGSWLAASGALPDFVDQVFLRGPSSKGSLAQMLARPLTTLVEDVYEIRHTVLAVAVFMAVVWIGRLRLPEESRRDALGARAYILGLALVGVAAVAVGAATSGIEIHPFLAQIPLAIPMRLMVLVSGALTLALALRYQRAELDPRNLQLWLLAWVSFAIAMFASLSWALILIGAVPGVPLLVAYLLSIRPAKPLAALWVTAVVAGLFVSSVVLVQRRIDTPYAWAGWREPPVWEATETSNLGPLEGLRMSPETKRIVESVARGIQQNSAKGDRVLVYPHMPMFYLLADRAPMTFAPVHFFDVCPDYVAFADAELIRQSPPDVFVFFQFPEEWTIEAERNFRGGRPSGQREIEDVLRSLTQTYRLVASHKSPGSEYPLEVWARP